ncbi:hypothetical protein BB560_003063 [Smittium megazygosporum]|uniref:Uncharacterized protein n=1 Tax=Smittium megazygosporum TaxID=133381 RepID=A0A2T9ZD19_9FUNG|nr:hypothetical protein BB560_003063 [Smittium megazygosporum]
MFHIELRMSSYSMTSPALYFYHLQIIFYIGLIVIEVYQDKLLAMYSHMYSRIDTSLLGSLEDESKPTPEDFASIFSSLLLLWYNPIIKLGSSDRGIQRSDLSRLPESVNTKSFSQKFWEYWQYETLTGRNSVTWVLSKRFGGCFLLSGLIKFIYSGQQNQFNFSTEWVNITH